jgi:hypothetical protein
MKNKKMLLLASFILLLVFAHTINVSKASISDETPVKEESPLVEVVQLSDGTIERHYANGTIRHDYFVTLQFQPNITFTTATMAMKILFWVPPTDPPDNDFSPNTSPIFLFVCVVGAAGIMRIFKSRLGRKPVERPMPKLPFDE